MRIRKRPVLFPSSVSPLPLSDPHLISRSPVVVQLSEAASTAAKHSSSAVLHRHAASWSLDRCQPSDQSLPSIGRPSNGWDDPSGIGESGAHRQHNKQDPLEEVVVVGREEPGEDSGEKGNHTRKGRNLGLETLAGVASPLSPSFTPQDRWYEEEKAIPLKKRRGAFEENNSAATHSKKTKAKMKTKMNKKCSSRNEDSTEEEDEEERKVDDVNVSVSKKRVRGSALMEGSRCSRVNGRGWRCCQQTLVGYSLCEHHLGKGRLRSMTSVRSRSIASTAPKKVHIHHHHSSSSSSSLEKQNLSVAEPFVEEEEEEEKPEIITKKRMKLGVVKARSISSLLGQTNTQIAAVAHENSK
ncbi:uncharacterized protein LOC114164867 isoform X2 [Vigna unguiculata]|uniref:Growth-regulating factor n=1 Tax=Vigna unguiculata TaxID=3917 RepID=A0A4D6MCK7_VIGUN|nr:uncharacterized protein LOC114164867 isoform X2 [Vigna unguiculata]QCD97524.1 Growth-regulating factor [Vigna unguiculata]